MGSMTQRERSSRRIASIVQVVLTAAVAGCTPTDSVNVRTQGIWARYVGEQTAEGPVTVHALFRVGGPLGTPLRFAGEDHIVVNGVAATDGPELVTVEPDPDGIYDVSFVRGDEVISSTLGMPPAPAFLAFDPEDAIVQTPDTLTLTWDATEAVAGSRLDVRITGTCFQNAHMLVEDTGELTTATLATASETGCPIDLTLIRSALTSVSSDFEGGSAEGYRTVRHRGELLPLLAP